MADQCSGADQWSEGLRGKEGGKTLGRKSLYQKQVEEGEIFYGRRGKYIGGGLRPMLFLVLVLENTNTNISEVVAAGIS